MKATLLHILGVLLRWTVSSPEHAIFAAGGAVVLFLVLRSRPEPEQVVVRSGGLIALVAVVGGLVAGWYLLTHPPKAAPKPVTRTVYVHQTVTKVVQVAGHSGLPPWAIVAIAVVALGALCGLTLGRRAES